jgi:serine/threonine-protein kinase
VAAFALVIGAGVALWQAREARLQAERARTEAATAQAVQSFIEAVFRANSGDQADPQKARDATARQLLDLGAQRIEHELRDAPEARLRLLKTLADMYQDMALLDRTAELQRQRVALARQTLGARHPQTAQALADLAYVLGFTDRRKEATEAVTEAAAILDAIGDRASRERFSVDLTIAFLNTRVDFATALAAADRAVANARTRPPSADFVRALQIQGEVATYSGQHAKARDAAVEAIGLVEAEPALGANMLSPMVIMLAEAQLGLGELDDAAASFQRALALARRHNAVAPVYIHTAERVYANFLRRQGRFRESLETSRPASAWARSVRGQFGIMPPTLVTDHARVLIAYGHVDDGLAAMDEALAMLAGIEEAPEVTAGIQLFRALGLIEQGRYAEADAAIAQAQAFYASGKLGRAPLLSVAKHALQIATGQADAALRGFQAERVGRGQSAVPTSDEPVRVLLDSAWLHLHAGQSDAAREQAEQAVAAIERHRFRAYQAELEAQATQVLGVALLRRNQIAAADVMLARSLALHRTVYDPERSLAVADVLLAHAQVQRAQGRRSDADRSIAEARRIHATHRAVGEHHLAGMLTPPDAPAPAGRVP